MSGLRVCSGDFVRRRTKESRRRQAFAKAAAKSEAYARSAAKDQFIHRVSSGAASPTRQTHSGVLFWESLK